MSDSEIDISKILPQAAPFIMIDAVDHYVPGKSLTTVKNVTANEWLCENHSPIEPVFPEALLIEGAAQTAIVFSVLEYGKDGEESPQVALGKITAEFDRQVIIGSQVRFTTTTFKVMRGRGFVDVEMTCEDDRVGSVSIFYSFMMGAGDGKRT